MTARNKPFVEVLAISFLFAFAVILAGIWFAAAATGNEITVTVNEYGERTPELLMWAIVVPIISVGLHRWSTA